MDEVLSNLDQPSLCLSLIRSAQFFLLNSVFGILISDLMILTNIFGFTNNIVATFPGKPVLFIENYKALSRNTSRYENQEFILKNLNLNLILSAQCFEEPFLAMVQSSMGQR